MSDREIVMQTDFLHRQFNNGDSVMGGMSFTNDNLLPSGVRLKVPPFLEMQGQMTDEAS